MSEPVPLPTHEVLNQPEPLADYNPFDQDPALVEALQREGGGAFAGQVRAFGAVAGSEMLAAGFEANENPPRLRTHDRFGRRIDRVDYHPAYHRIMALGLGHGLAALTWSGRSGARLARSAMMYLHNQFEAGTMCPITMTHAVIPTLRVQPETGADWEKRILAGEYDPAFRPAGEKRGVTVGMAMTEKQGGSDVRANTTRARPLDEPGPGREYELTGHKWFCSAPMSDAFLMLAQTGDGPGCFLVPRLCPDGSVNPIHLMRLKDKLGNRANASAEIELPGTRARLIGEPGRGIATIIRMVAETRLDCAIGSASLMRQAVSQAIHHCDGRKAFGKTLSRQPLMTSVLADLALEAEAAMSLALHLAGLFERGENDQQAAALARIATPLAKYWICKRAVGVVNEAQECLGGAGYVEESILPRLYRETPLNAIWEGSGNIQCLDMLRAIWREPQCLEAWRARLEPAAADEPRLARLIGRVDKALADTRQAEAGARLIAGDMALGLQAALLLEHAPAAVSTAFCDARLDPHPGALFGALPGSIDSETILARARPRGH